jgi:hypothetical protein
MDDDQLLVLAKQFVEIKVPFVDAAYKEELATEVRDKIEETINLELLSYLEPEQADAYDQLLAKEGTSEDEIISFIKSCSIDIDTLTATALTKFRVAYLGA